MPLKKSENTQMINLSLNENYTSQLKLSKTQLEQFKSLAFNRYPTNHCYSEIEKRAAQLYKISSKKVLVCNGSDDGIFLLLQHFALPKKQQPIVTLEPTFSMYEHYAFVLGIKVIRSKLNEHYYPNIDDVITTINTHKASCIFLPNPLAPTGGSISKKEIIHLVEACPNTTIIIDEAYIEFSSLASLKGLVRTHENVILLRTLSKFYGLAALRLGFIISNKRANIKKIQAPFSVSGVNAWLGIEALNTILKKDNSSLKKKVTTARQRLLGYLKRASFVSKVSDSEANFIYLETPLCQKLSHYLNSNGFEIKNFHPKRPQALRIGIPAPKKVNTLIKVIKQFEENC